MISVKVGAMIGETFAAMGQETSGEWDLRRAIDSS